MSNRKLRTFSRGLSIHELRRMALGEELIQFCDREEPEIRGMYMQMREQVKQLIAINAQETLGLELMIKDDDESPSKFLERKRAALERTFAQARDLISMLRDLDKLIDRMSAGGGAAVWAGMQRGMARKQEEQREEREVKQPIRKWSDVQAARAARLGKAAPIDADAEVVDADAGD